MYYIHPIETVLNFKTFRTHTRIGPPQTFIEHAIYFLTDTDKKLLIFT